MRPHWFFHVAVTLVKLPLPTDPLIAISFFTRDNPRINARAHGNMCTEKVHACSRVSETKFHLDNPILWILVTFVKYSYKHIIKNRPYSYLAYF